MSMPIEAGGHRPPYGRCDGRLRNLLNHLDDSDESRVGEVPGVNLHSAARGGRRWCGDAERHDTAGMCVEYVDDGELDLGGVARIRTGHWHCDVPCRGQ